MLQIWVMLAMSDREFVNSATFSIMSVAAHSGICDCVTEAKWQLTMQLEKQAFL